MTTLIMARSVLDRPFTKLRAEPISRSLISVPQLRPGDGREADLSVVIHSRRLTVNAVVSASLPANLVVRGERGVLGGRAG